MSGIYQVKRTFSKAVRISSFAEALEKLIYLSAIALGLGFIIFVLIMMVAFMGVKLFLAFTSDVEIIRSPSFSLFSSSTNMNIPPFFAIFIIVSIDE